MKFIAIIPARYNSQRLEGKVLLQLAGKSIIQHVFEAASGSTKVSKVVIATDDERIFNEARNFGAECFMTKSDHSNGSSRCFEAFESLADDYDVLLNLQADEPFLLPSTVDALAEIFERSKKADIATLLRPAQDSTEILDSSYVKAVCGVEGKVHWFSRSALPHIRDIDQNSWGDRNEHLIHLGLYGFRSSVIEKIKSLGPSHYEQIEKLEQLRWIENGLQINASIINDMSFGIDTPIDLEKARKILET